MRSIPSLPSTRSPALAHLRPDALARVRSPLRVRALACALAIFALAPATALAATSPVGRTGPVGATVPGELIVIFEPGTTSAQRAAARSAVNAELERSLRLPGAQLVQVEGSVGAAARRLERRPGVRFAQPNYRYQAQAAPPNDTRFGELWGLRNIGQPIGGRPGASGVDVNALSAWDHTRGAGTEIAIADSGVDPFHPDLQGSLWTNPGDPRNGVDDDRNGFVDDVQGADFVQMDADPDDFAEHGTHVAATAAAAANNARGVAGVAPEARIMAVRVLDGDGAGTTATVASGISYAATEGADVINLSLSAAASPADQVMSQAVDIAATHGSVVVAAAGNEGSNNDAVPQTPCVLPQPNLICVASVENDGSLSGFSNFGPATVDVGAPGGRVLSARTDYDAVFADPFAMGLPGWTRGGSWGPSNVAASPPVSATDSPTGSYASNVNATLVRTGALSLVGRLGCRLDFAMRLATAPGDDGDALFFGAISGATDLYTGVNGSTGGNFVKNGVSLSQRIGPDGALTGSLDGADGVRPYFQFVSDADGLVGDGAYVDDVVLNCRTPRGSAEADEYHSLDGTSMAAPHVAGAAALVRGGDPGAPATQVVQALRETVRPLASLQGVTATGGVVDANGAIARARQLANPVTVKPPTRRCRGLRGKRLKRCRLAAKVRRVCGKKRGRAKKLCAKRVRALAKCAAIRVPRRGRKAKRRQARRKAACVRRAKKIGRARKRAGGKRRRR